MPDNFRLPDNFRGDDPVAPIADPIAEQIRRYMQRHRLKLPGMAAHVGISRNTLKPIVTGHRKPRSEARALIMAALAAPPPPRPEPPHAAIVREHWGRESSETIGARVGVSGARIRAIAAAIGLTGDQDSQAA